MANAVGGRSSGGSKAAGRPYRRVLAAAAVGLLGVAGLVGCGSGMGSGGKNGLTFYVNVTPTLTRSFWQKQVDGFTKTHKDAKITLVDSKGQDVTKYFATLVASKSVPDVIGVPPGDMGKYHTVLKPFDTSASWVRFPGYQSQEYQGKLYGVSSATTAYGLIFYNKDYFAKAGITAVPTSMAELTADLAKLKTAGYTPLETSGDFVLGFQFSSLTYPSLFTDDPNFYLDVAKGKATFADSAFQKIADYYAGWVKNGYFRKGVQSTTYDTSEKEFAAGKTAMYPLAGWYTPALNQAKSKYHIGVFKVPTISGAPAPLESDPINTYYISKNVQNNDLAVQFVKYLSTDPTAVRNFVTADGDYSTATPPVTRPMTPIEHGISQLINSAVKTGKTIPCCDGATNSGNGAAGIQDELDTLVGNLQLGKSPAGFGKALDQWRQENTK